MGCAHKKNQMAHFSKAERKSANFLKHVAWTIYQFGLTDSAAQAQIMCLQIDHGTSLLNCAAMFREKHLDLAQSSVTNLTCFGD